MYSFILNDKKDDKELKEIMLSCIEKKRKLEYFEAQ